MLASENLGIVILTNGQPVGVPEAISNTFLDTAQTGGPTVDWLAFFGPLREQAAEGDRSPVDYNKPPASPAPAEENSAYTGTYANDYYGTMTVSAQGDELTCNSGPRNSGSPCATTTVTPSATKPPARTPSACPA